MGTATSVVEVTSDGRARLRLGLNEQGSGAHTVLSQIVAHELELSLDSVDLVLDATDRAPFDSGSSASRVTYVTGLATQHAARAALDQLRALAAEYLGSPESQIALRDGAFIDTTAVGVGGRSIAFAELAKRAIAPDAPVVGNGAFQDYSLADTPSFAAVVAEVQVDPETGEVCVQKLTTVCDVGTVLNPTGVRGQLEGGLVQGLGLASMEDLRLSDDGRVETVSLADYKLPTARDTPAYVSEWITEAPGVGPYGAKSIGELTTPLAPPAISNAVYSAVGVRIVDLPVTAERVFEALHSA
jgi:CO/xanthine dehydrogenase Mo-binding subunit